MRAASSKGAADLIVLWPWRVKEKLTDELSVWVERPVGQVWIVQAKRNGRLPKGELIELRRIAEETGALPVLAKAGPNGRGVEFTVLDGQEC